MASLRDIGNSVENGAKDIYDDLFRVQQNKIVPHITPDGPGLPQRIKDSYDHMLSNSGKSLWRGMMAAASTGFGKGVMVAAAVLVVGSGLALGLMAATGALTVAGAPVLASTAFFSGIGLGFSNLLSAGGLATLAFGGAIGAFAGVRREQANISAEVAKTQAQDYELMRRMQQAHVMQPAMNTSAMDTSFRDREDARRAEALLNKNLGLH